MQRVAVRRMFRGYRVVALARELAIYAGRLPARLTFEMGENDLWTLPPESPRALIS